MSLESDSIPNLIQGVSQQPARLRLPSQLDAQENCYSSPVEGLGQRPPLEHIAKISDTPLAGALIHTINRTATQRFKAIFSNGLVQVFDLLGIAKTVSAVDDTTSILSGAVAIVNGATFEMATAPAETAIDFTTAGITTATVKLQLSVDGISWSDADTRTTNGTTVGVVIGTGKYMRAIVSAWTAGTISASVTYKNYRYLLTATAKTSMHVLTVADYTFVVNQEKIPAMAAALSPTRTEEGLIFVKKGEYGSVYSVYIDEVLRATYTTSTTDVLTLSTTNIATDLYNDLVAWAGVGFTFTLIGSVIWVQKTSAFKMRSQDAQGGNSLEIFKGVTTKFSNLPVEAPDGFVIAVDANPETTQGQYYVAAHVTQTGVSFGPVSWQESVAPGITTTLSPQTMPYSLIHNVDDSFTFQAITWDQRAAGDATTNLIPSFIGNAIHSILFYKNRLGFLADEDFCFSEIGQYFNFFRNTVTQIKDSDPIDSRAVDIKVSILKQGLLFNKSLIMFSDSAQFEIPSDAPFTPQQVRCDVVSNFESLSTVTPINAGNVINFLFSRDTYVGLKELFVSQSNALVMVAEEVSDHVPTYIPQGAFAMTVSTLEGVTAILTDGDPGSIYVYKTTLQSEKKVQSAWFRWNLDDYTTQNVTVLSADFIGSVLYVLVQRNSKVYLEKLQLLPNRVDPFVLYITLLDRRVDNTQLVSAVYDIGSNITTLTLPYDITSTQVAVATRGVVDNTGFADVGKSLTVLSATVGQPIITVRGNYATNPLWLGQRILASITLSPIFVRSASVQKTGTIDPAGKLQLLKGAFNYSKTGSFAVYVTPKSRNTSIYPYTGRVLGDSGNIIGTITLTSGRHPFSILANNEQVTIMVMSNDFLPFHLTSMEWEGNYTKRSRGR